MTGEIFLHEVGLRDGLQMEKQIVPMGQKANWVEEIIDAGADIIQLGSFVRPEKVPQMADTDGLFRYFSEKKRPSPVIFSGLVLNEKGLERGLACGVDMFCMGVSASDTHSRKNTGMSTEEATEHIIRIALAAVEAKKKVQLSVQSAFGCGYEGHVPQERVIRIVERYLNAGIRTISLADTAGHASPDRVEQMFTSILEYDEGVELACHFHNTFGMALANCYAALKVGVRYFESSVAGLGGCPFTKIAGGNVCTEDLVHMLQRMDRRLDIRLDRLVDTANDIAKFFGRPMPGTVYKMERLFTVKSRVELNALAGIRVLDLTNVLSGPFATLHLALLGAEVIKIENPRDGDLARKLGNVPELNDRLMGTSFLAQNANKKSLTLNLKEPEAKEIFRTLAGKADVLVENFRPDVMARLGLGYDALKTLNPRLIYCAISGFGQTGPDALKPAYDQIIQGLSGVMAINGDEDSSPLRCGFPVCDTVGGLSAAFAIIAALYHREKTGEGQFIDVALLDSIMPLMGWVAANLLIGGRQPVLMGNDNFTAAPSGTFAVQDGCINIAANKQEQWEALADVIGLPELKADPRFQKRDARKKHRRELTALLEKKLVEKPGAHWVEALNAKGVPAGEILSLADALNQAQIRHRGTIGTVDAGDLGELKVFNLTPKFEKTPGRITCPPPRLGAHTEGILTELGISDNEIRRLKKEGIV